MTGCRSGTCCSIATRSPKRAAGWRRCSATARAFWSSEIGAALGISRKYSVPLLEHLDAIQFTRRVGDRRMLALAPAPE